MAKETKVCVYCRSHQVVEHRNEVVGVVSLMMHCNMCRRDLVYWTGTVVEEKRFKKSRRRNMKRFS